MYKIIPIFLHSITRENNNIDKMLCIKTLLKCFHIFVVVQLPAFWSLRLEAQSEFKTQTKRFEINALKVTRNWTFISSPLNPVNQRYMVTPSEFRTQLNLQMESEE